ncbi:MAG: hypothetical protein D6809_01125 [Gammaproteobacteria bacterium]|nr:MAG: hypothetical protein D6809_01125 [Gammaproteobacteria bacterium]
MASGRTLPRAHAWYRAEDGSLFEVVAVDEQDASVELQYQDGTLEELDLEAWDELGARPISGPPGRELAEGLAELYGEEAAP